MTVDGTTKWLLVFVLDLSDSTTNETAADIRRRLQLFRNEILNTPSSAASVEFTIITASVPVKKVVRPTGAKSYIIPVFHPAHKTDIAEGIRAGLSVIQVRQEYYRQQEIRHQKPVLIVITDNPDRAEQALQELTDAIPYIVSANPDQKETVVGEGLPFYALSSISFSLVNQWLSGHINWLSGRINRIITVPTTPSASEQRPVFEQFSAEERAHPVEGWPPDSALQNMPGAWAAFKETTRRSGQEQPINCSVYAPETVQPGHDFLIVATLFPPEGQAASDRLAKRIAPEASSIATKLLLESLQPGQRVTFRLLLKGGQIDEPVQEIKWRGNLTSVEFMASLPNDFALSTVYASLSVFSNTVPLGSFRFSLTIANARTETRQTPVFSRFRQAFISYSSKDRAEVLKRVQGIEAVGQAVFVDLLNLASGERWESVIHQQITRCDVFYLFWSSEAKRSKWVKHEWQYALELRGQRPNQSPDIIPVIIEGPPPPEPLRPLRHLHFNDRHLYFIGKS